MSVTTVTGRAGIAGLHSVLAPSRENVNIVFSQSVSDGEVVIFSQIIR